MLKYTQKKMKKSDNVLTDSDIQSLKYDDSSKNITKMLSKVKQNREDSIHIKQGDISAQTINKMNKYTDIIIHGYGTPENPSGDRATEFTLLLIMIKHQLKLNNDYANIQNVKDIVSVLNATGITYMNDKAVDQQIKLLKSFQTEIAKSNDVHLVMGILKRSTKNKRVYNMNEISHINNVIALITQISADKRKRVLEFTKVLKDGDMAITEAMRHLGELYFNTVGLLFVEKDKDTITKVQSDKWGTNEFNRKI